MGARSMGVEEELLLVEPGTGLPLAVAESALGPAEQDTAGDPPGSEPPDQTAQEAEEDETLDFELQQQQLETNTRVCHDLDELRDELRRGRSLAVTVAARAGARLAALATS